MRTGKKKQTYSNEGPFINEKPVKAPDFSLIRKLWGRILDAIAWMTQDQARISARKNRRAIDYIRFRGFR
jgi:hypothetical protein